MELECLWKESEAGVATATTLAGNAAQAVKSMAQTSGDDKDLQDEVCPKVLNLSFEFVKLSQKEIVKIFRNKFKPMILYQLWAMQGLVFEAYQDKKKIGIKNRILKLRKTSRT